MTEKVITLRVAIDTSEVPEGGKVVQRAMREMGDEGAKAAEGIGKATAATNGMEQAGKRMAETLEQQATRIRAMVDASLAAKEGAGGIELSQRALAERSAGVRQALEAQAAATRTASSEQERMAERMRQFEEAEMRAARAASTAQAGMQKQSESLSDLLGKIDPVVKKLGELDAMEEKLHAFRKSGQIGGDDFDEYAQKIARTRGEVVEAASGMHAFSLASAGAKRELAVLIGEIARGDFSRLQGSLLTLANRTGLFTGALAGLAVGVGSIVVALGSFVAALVAGYLEQQAFDRAVIATGGSAGVTGGQIADMAERIGLSTGRYNEATEALTKLASGGRLTGEQLEIAGRGAVALATLAGTSAEKAASEFEKLADKPAATIAELNKQYHFLTTGLYEHIAALERSGHTTEAATAAMRAFADMSEARASKVVDNAGAIERAWNAVRDSIKGAWSAMKDIGRTDLEARLAAAKKEVEGYEAFQESYLRGQRGGGGLDKLRYLGGSLLGSYDRSVAGMGDALARVQALEAEKRALDETAKSQAAYQTVQDAAVEIQKRLTDELVSHADKQTKMAVAIAKTRDEFAKLREAGVTTLNGMSLANAEAERIRQLNDQFKDVKGINAREQALRRLVEFEREMYALQGRSLIRLSEVDKENQRHVSALQKIAQAGAQRIDDLRRAKAGEEALARVQSAVVAGIKEENEVHTANLAVVSQRLTATQSLKEKLQEELSAIGQTNDEREMSNALRQAEHALIKEGIDLQSSEAAAYLDEVAAIQKSISVRAKAADDAREIARGWVSIAEEGGRSISRMFSEVLVNGGSLFRGLKDMARNTVASIIEYFSQLAIINPLLNSIFGRSMAAGGMSLLPTFASAATGGSMGGGGFDFMSPSSWINAGKSLWSGFSGAGSVSGSSWLGSYLAPGSQYATVGNINMSQAWANGGFGSGGSMGSFTPSPYAWGMAAAGGLYAGWNRWQGSNHDFMGGVGAAAYGVGTAAVGLGAAGAMTGGMAGGMAGLGALGPIGWVALAAMLVDMISGGKLFGTGWRPNDSKQTIGLSPEGGTASLVMGEVRQGALFSGRKWRDKVLETPPELQDAADRFFRYATQAMQQAATASRSELTEMIDANIRTVTEYDKKGNVKATKFYVEALGRQWEEASAELAAKRVLAEAQIAQLASSSAGSGASEVAERWRYSAEALADGTAFMLQAVADIARGNALLGEGTSLQATTDFVESMQQMDESLVQAYQRVSGAVALLDQALQLSGVTLDMTREEVVRFAASIADAAGGLQAAQDLWKGYFSAYYSESETSATQLLALRDTVSTGLSDLGLSAEIGMDDFRKQFEEALPRLTPEEVVTWLKAANALAQLTAAQAQLEQKVAEVLGPMGLLGQGLSQFGSTLVAIKAKEATAIDASNALAKSRGAEGASAMQLAAIHQWTVRQIGAAIRQLQAETSRLIADLYGEVPGSLDLINQRIAELEGAANSTASGIDRVADAGNNLFDQWGRGIKSVQDYLDSMLLGDLSALSPEEQIAEARRQLLDLQAAAMRGDTEALAKLPQMADAFLRLQKGALASGGDYNAEFDWVRQLLGSVAGMTNPYAQPGDGNTGGGAPTVITPSPELEALYKARDDAMAAQYAEQRRALAQQLTQHLADLATMLNVPIFELIEAQGVNLKELATDLGADLQNLTGKSVEVLGNMATTLGVPLGELVQKLGLTLPDLKDGLEELTKSLGIDLKSLTTGTVNQLAALAGSLGSNLTELSKALGIDLGKLTDVDSPIFVALKENIGSMAPDVKSELEPLLDAVKNAAGDEQKNAAVKALRDHVDAMAPDVREQLRPFFDDLKPTKAIDQLGYLKELQSIAEDQLSVLGTINANLAAMNREMGVPSYAIGTGYVRGDQLANIHNGEAVVPAAVNTWFRSANWQLPRASGSDATVTALRRIEGRLESLERSNAVGQDKLARTIEAGDKQASAQRAEQVRVMRDNGTARSTTYGR